MGASYGDGQLRIYVGKSWISYSKIFRHCVSQLQFQLPTVLLDRTGN